MAKTPRDLIIESFMGEIKPVIGELEQEELGEEEHELDEEYVDGEKREVDALKSDIILDSIRESDVQEINYLKDDPLSRDFMFQRDITKPCKLGIMLYNINDDAYKPFLEILLKKQDGVLDFPTIDLDMEAFSKVVPVIEEEKAEENIAVAEVLPAEVPSPEQTSPEQTSPEQTSPEQTSPEQTSPEQTSPEQTSPEQTSPEQTSPEQTSPEQTSPEQTSPEQTSPEQTSPEQTFMQSLAQPSPIQSSAKPEQVLEQYAQPEALVQEQTPAQEQTPTQVQEQMPVQTPVQTIAQPPVQSIAQTPPVQTPAQPPVQTPAQPPPQMPVQTPAQTPAQPPPQTPPQTQENPLEQMPKQFGGEDPLQDDPFFEQCVQFYQQITSLSVDVAKHTYKGFVKVGDDMVIAIFDHTEYTDENETTSSMQTVTIYEIINKKPIFDMTLSENVFNAFIENPIITYILDDETRQGIDIPIVVYLCKEAPNNEYDNVFYESEDEKRKQRTLVNTPVFHEYFGTTNLFSMNPLDQTNLNLIKRFATFTQNTVYLLNKEIPLQEYKYIKEKLSVCFWENENEFLSVKTTDLFIEL
uniref:Uncharacterized protein n=1 Tax=viral metagenome TaxID=1070528 RepID=A0A6C0D359_9ZZZZ